MDIKDKVIDALSRNLNVDYMRLEDDDGVSGFVVSSEFADMSAIDRQLKIEDALGNAKLNPQERRQILMIAGITPAEYDAVGSSIRVVGVHEKKGEVEIVVHGGVSDAQYVRAALKGIQTTDPRRVAGAQGILMHFRARGAAGTPLTKDKVVRLLKKTRYIAVMLNG